MKKPPEFANNKLRDGLAYPGIKRIHIVHRAILTSPESPPDHEKDGSTFMLGRSPVRCGECSLPCNMIQAGEVALPYDIEMEPFLETWTT